LVDIIVDGGESAKKDLCTLLGRFERRGVAGWRLFRQTPVLRVLYYADDLCWMKATMSRSTWTR